MFNENSPYFQLGEKIGKAIIITTFLIDTISQMKVTLTLLYEGILNFTVSTSNYFMVLDHSTSYIGNTFILENFHKYSSMFFNKLFRALEKVIFSNL